MYLVALDDAEIKVNQISGMGELIKIIAFIFDIFTATRPYRYIFYSELLN